MRSMVLRRWLTLGIASAILGSCTVEEPEVRPETQTFPSSEATNATTVFLTGSVVTTRIQSHRIVHYAVRDSAWAYEMVIEFFDETGAPSSVMHADSALVREKARFLEVYGDVRIVTEDGRTLTTDRLAWNDASGRIHTESYVEITEGDDLMAGYGFESNPELTDIKLRRVTGKISDPERLDSL